MHRCPTAESVLSAEQRTDSTDKYAEKSQKVHNDTKPSTFDLLRLSRQLLQPKREAAEGTTGNSEKAANNENLDTPYGANNIEDVYVLCLLKFIRYFSED